MFTGMFQPVTIAVWGGQKSCADMQYTRSKRKRRWTYVIHADHSYLKAGPVGGSLRDNSAALCWLQLFLVPFLKIRKGSYSLFAMCVYQHCLPQAQRYKHVNYSRKSSRRPTRKHIRQPLATMMNVMWEVTIIHTSPLMSEFGPQHFSPPHISLDVPPRPQRNPLRPHPQTERFKFKHCHLNVPQRGTKML